MLWLIKCKNSGVFINKICIVKDFELKISICLFILCRQTNVHSYAKNKIYQNCQSYQISRCYSIYARKSNYMNTRLCLGAELRDIQRQIDSLEKSNDPDQVCQFLMLRRDVMYLEFDVAIRHTTCETFLSTGNIASYQVNMLSFIR